MARTEHQMEQLSSALDAVTRTASVVKAGAMNSFTLREMMRAQNVLFDRALAAGMSFDEPNVEEWAATRVGEWLVSQ